MALEAASSDLRKKNITDVPDHLKDTHYKGAKDRGLGEGYKYPHAYKEAWVEQSYLRVPQTYYVPSDQGYEATIAKRMEMLKGAF